MNTEVTAKNGVRSDFIDRFATSCLVVAILFVVLTNDLSSVLKSGAAVMQGRLESVGAPIHFQRCVKHL